MQSQASSQSESVYFCLLTMRNFVTFSPHFIASLSVSCANYCVRTIVSWFPLKAQFFNSQLGLVRFL